MKWRNQKQSLRSILRNVIPIGNPIFNEQGAIRERDREGRGDEERVESFPPFFTPSGCKDKETRKLEFKTKLSLLCLIFW